MSLSTEREFHPDASTPIEIVARYLDLSSRRRLAEAQNLLSDEAKLVFPNGTFHRVADMVDATVSRYRSIGKVLESWDVARGGDGSVVVVSTGTLHGINSHGVPFSGIRYIDRFVLRDGKIILQQVWNDLAESGVLELRE